MLQTQLKIRGRRGKGICLFWLWYEEEGESAAKSGLCSFCMRCYRLRLFLLNSRVFYGNGASVRGTLLGLTGILWNHQDFE